MRVLFLLLRERRRLSLLILGVGKEARLYVPGRTKLYFEHFCHFHGGGHPYCGHFPHRAVDVSGSDAADRKRLRLLAKVVKGCVCGGMEASYEHRGMEITEGAAGAAAKTIQSTGITEEDGSYSIIAGHLAGARHGAIEVHDRVAVIYRAEP